MQAYNTKFMINKIRFNKKFQFAGMCEYVRGIVVHPLIEHHVALANIFNS